MKKRKVWLLGICIALLLIGLGSFLFIKHILPYKGTDTELLEPGTPFNEDNIIPAWKIPFIKVGMTYEEVIHIIGKANRAAGSGMIHYQYECNNGKKLCLWITPAVNGNRWIWQKGLEDADGSFVMIDSDVNIQNSAYEALYQDLE